MPNFARRLPGWSFVFVLFALAGNSVWAAPQKDEAKPGSTVVGRQVQDFALQDYRGKEHKLSDLADTQIVVLAVLGTECPLAKLYGPRLAELSQQYADQGVAFLGINANRQDSITEIAAYARVHEIPFPLLKDLGNRVVDQLGAVRTPEVFVLDRERKIRYWGRIDDRYGVGYQRDKAEREDLQLAIEDLLAGREVARPMTVAVGCHIGRVYEPDPDSDVTYSNQISRILQKRCVECHREGQIAPFALTKYEEVVGWAETIAEVVRDERMPPWHASAEHGSFANDRRMSKEEKDLLYRWADAGAPEGDPQQLPEPQQYTEGWALPSEPDVVVNMRSQPYQVPAEGIVRYQYFSADPGFNEDRWVKMAEVLPGNRAVVHHVLVMIQPPSDRRDAPGVAGGQFLAAYVPGLLPKPFPNGMAKLVPAGSKLIFQMHYTPIGSPQIDLSKVGFIFAKPEEVTHAVVTVNARQRRLDIPPHAENHRVEATSNSAPTDVLLLTLMPHMHLRGKAFRYEAQYPDGKSEVLMDVPSYDFNWQTSYRLSEPKLMPAGSRVHCVAHFDNSANNLANPDPSQTVHWGDQTWNEMMIGYFDIAIARSDLAAGKPAPMNLGGGGLLSPVNRARFYLKRYDKNGDGLVEKEELPAQLHNLADRLDTDKDGKVSAEELAELLKRE